MDKDSIKRKILDLLGLNHIGLGDAIIVAPILTSVQLLQMTIIVRVTCGNDVYLVFENQGYTGYIVNYLGKYYGYKQCCIDNYIKHRSGEQNPTENLHGEFVACDSCDNEPYKSVVDYINTHRIAPNGLTSGVSLGPMENYEIIVDLLTNHRHAFKIVTQLK